MGGRVSWLVEWRRAAMLGALIGLAGAVAFFVLHALIIEPIWRAAWRAPLALANGALLGILYARLRAREPASFAHPLGGMLLGALAGLALAPFAIVGWMRARGAPDPFWILILALLSTSVYHVTQAVQSYDVETKGWRARVERLRRAELPAALLVVNALPAYFLTFLSDFHEETPDPIPFTMALATIYVGCGALLTGLFARGRGLGRDS